MCIALHWSYLKYVERLQFVNHFPFSFGCLAIVPLTVFCSLLSLSSLCVTPITYSFVHLIVPHISLRLCSFISSFFSLCSSECIISIALSSSLLILSSAHSINCWAPLVRFSFYFTFKSRIFTWFFLIVVISLLIFSIWWNIVSIPSSTYLSIILFNYLKVVIMAALTPFVLNLTSVLLTGTFLAWLFSSLWVTLSCFFVSL